MIHEKKITVEASSIEEALNDVSGRWQIPAEKLHAEIIGEERKGFLGLGGKTLRVEITANLDENHDAKENRQDLFLRGADFVNETLKLMDFNAQAVISESDKNTLDIQGEDASDYVVGRYGDALKGMEYLVNLALRDPKYEPRIKIDSCGYRERRTKSLERLAEATARQAVKYGRPVRLEPMASWERWVIHTTLKDRSDITTESVGEPPLRKVVVMPKYDPERDGAAGPAMMRVRARRERVSRPVSRPPRRGSRRSAKQ
ncbi:MAG: RNA-binding cell elongation regulator Jag/EloR [Synergistales bacterium]|nr:RNA-binding cell elongation regulator Jag/EloR [Synergistales bacterium]MDY6400765.1 RNA-binding cell elongation regulator Jag/EloR [Synergistales bacterium]MDY6405288.1 RNA-binding cell elongation regulator Jag/EloR [Synergistales bacterium]MDY6410978.1 RNA-binding cell elongation regulator Jag/EloR [Synergistales bacterium]MDY6414143.1 RNA-binding cell elongation regulator Jag/EloR [Synergistales bacterium]